MSDEMYEELVGQMAELSFRLKSDNKKIEQALAWWEATAVLRQVFSKGEAYIVSSDPLTVELRCKYEVIADGLATCLMDCMDLMEGQR